MLLIVIFWNTFLKYYLCSLGLFVLYETLFGFIKFPMKLSPAPSVENHCLKPFLEETPIIFATFFVQLPDFISCRTLHKVSFSVGILFRRKKHFVICRRRTVVWIVVWYRHFEKQDTTQKFETKTKFYAIFLFPIIKLTANDKKELKYIWVIYTFYKHNAIK